MLSVGSNFGRKSLCPACYIALDEQSHLGQCMVIRINSPLLLNQHKNTNLTNIFSTDTKILIDIASTLENVMRTREKILQK